MVESENTSPRLAELRRRWEENRDSRVFLQLAEEYRRHGQNAEAADVLEEGLQNRPNDVAARVALGRCRLDLDEIAPAIASLEGVIAQDPAHIVASKLLVDGYLRAGDAAKARERLSFYRLLNDRDPELDHFEYRLEQIEPSGGRAAVDPEAETGPISTLSRESETVESLDDTPTRPEPFDLGAPIPERDDAIFAPSRLAASAPKRGSDVKTVSRPVPTSGNGHAQIPRMGRAEPFGALTAPPEPPDSLWSNGPFQAFAALIGVTGLATVARDLTTEETAEIPIVPESETPDTDDDAAALTEADGVEADPVAAADPVEADRVEADRVEADRVEADRVEADLGLDDTVDLLAEPEPETEPEAEVEAAVFDADDEGAMPATIAMADIYAEQGHPDEAVDVLERIVAADPANVEARSRLAALVGDSATQVESEPVDPVTSEIDATEVEVAGFEVADVETDAAPAEIDEVAEADAEAADAEVAEADSGDEVSEGPLTAADLLGDAPLAGLTARKVHLLERYLTTLRRGRDRRPTETGNVS